MRRYNLELRSRRKLELVVKVLSMSPSKLSSRRGSGTFVPKELESANWKQEEPDGDGKAVYD